MTVPVSATQRTRFYRASLMGLRALDASERNPRRFGSGPHARWQGFGGHLGTAGRIDLLIRDAAVKWGAGFAPATVFGLPGLADDEPFGPDWAALPEHEAKRMWTDVPPTVDIAMVANVFDIDEVAMPLPPITASTRLLVAGGPALCAVGAHFLQHPELSWSDQVLVVAEQPRIRHLAGLMAPLVRALSQTRLVRPSDDVRATLASASFSFGATPITSADARPAALDFVRDAQRG